MAIGRFFRSIVDPEAMGEQIIISVQGLYEKTKNLNPAEDPHMILAMTYFARVRARIINMPISRKIDAKDPDTGTLVLVETLLFACLEEGHNVRALALHILKDERPDIWERFPRFQSDFDLRLTRLISSLESGASLFMLYKRRNPQLQLEHINPVVMEMLQSGMLDLANSRPNPSPIDSKSATLEAERFEANHREKMRREEAERRDALRREEAWLAAKQRESERLDAEQLQAARDEASRKEAERLEAERRRTERVLLERQEAWPPLQRREAERRQELESSAASNKAKPISTEWKETERKDTAQLELWRKREEDRQRANEIEAQRLQAWRAGLEAREAERLEAEHKEEARLQAARDEASRKEAERQEAEGREAERFQLERQEAWLTLKRREAERLKADRPEAERRATDRLLAEKPKAQQINAERLAVDRLDATHSEAALLAEKLRTEAGRREAIDEIIRNRRQEEEREAASRISEKADRDFAAQFRPSKNKRQKSKVVSKANGEKPLLFLSLLFSLLIFIFFSFVFA